MPAAVMMAGTYFNPRSSCEERQLCVLTATWGIISIHAPHARSDDALVASVQELKEFQSTLLMRGATRQIAAQIQYEMISIHAPHARSDKDSAAHHALPQNFNPRSSCEERHDSTWMTCTTYNFNPRSSCEERRPNSRTSCRHSRHFNPRSSCEERLLQYAVRAWDIYFNPRSSCEERQTFRAEQERGYEFQSTLLMRGATMPLPCPSA